MTARDEGEPASLYIMVDIEARLNRGLTILVTPLLHDLYQVYEEWAVYCTTNHRRISSYSLAHDVK